MLSGQQIERLHKTSLAMLAEAGIRLQHTDLRQALAHRGCRVEGERVWLPRHLVEETLAQVPSHFTLFDRNGEPALTLGRGCRTASNSGVMPRIFDLDSGELRPATLADVAGSARVLDALPRIGILGITLVEATDVLPALAIVKPFETTLRNTTKPLNGPIPTNGTEAFFAVEIGTAVRGSLEQLAERPFFVPAVCIVSPLTYPEGLVDALRCCARAGLPLGVATNPVAGLSAPLTLAGALAQMHAEVLATIVLAYQIQPGLPILYKGSFSVAEMRTMAVMGGQPEVGLAKATAVSLAKHCGLPVTGYGLTTMAKQPGFQLGYEKAAHGVLCAQAGPDVLSCIGNAATGMIASYEALLLEHELVGVLWRIVDSVQVDADTLALQTVCDLMAGQDLWTHPHTVAHLRDGSRWQPTLGQELLPEDWLALGQPDIVEQARTQVRRLLKEHVPPPLAPQADARLTEVMGRAEAVIRRHK